MTGTNDFEYIRYDLPVEKVARVMLARPEMNNLQNLDMLYEIDRAYKRAVQDPYVKVIITAADGPDFSLGHDAFTDHWYKKDGKPLRDKIDPVTEFAGGYNDPGHAGHMAVEQEVFLGLCWRWRNLPKPTIAQVHGRVYNGGLMLMWPCDLVVASEDATFAESVVEAGVACDEFFVHVWELGHRKAKEFLFASEVLSAEEMHRLGSVNHVVARDKLEEFTLNMASRIAMRPSFALRTAKMAVNQSLDAQGMWSALQSAFSLHQLGNANASIKLGDIVDFESMMKIAESEGPSGASAAYQEIIARVAENQ